jgi:CMP/dCMP kinase
VVPSWSWRLNSGALFILFEYTLRDAYTAYMQKKRIITLAGRPGSGKSSTSRELASQLGYEHFSSGDLFRAIGKERGSDVHQTNLAAEKGSDIDDLVDQRIRDIGASQEDVVIDSRLAWHWIPESFKVYLNLDLSVAAQRILDNTDPVRLEHEHIPDDPEAYAAALEQRLASEARRYKALYDANPYDTNNYDLVIDTAKNDFNAVVNQILTSYKAWLKN